MPPGSATKALGALGHAALALVHVGHHVQFVQAGVADLALHQRLRDHADHASAGGQASASATTPIRPTRPPP